MSNELDYTVITGLDVSEVAEKLREALKGKGYGILSTIDMQKILKEKNGQDIDPYMILDVCNPKHAGTAMDRHRGTGLALPCKITVHREGGKTEVSLLKPTVALGMTGFDDLAELANKVEAEIKDSMDSISD